MFRFIAKVILSLVGWKAKPEGPFPFDTKKYVMIVAPHTSSWDFIIGVLYRSALKLEKARYLGKMELFKPPFGFIFRWLGGTPVDRSSNQNVVESVVSIFNSKEEFGIALSPEGTRKKVDQLKTGFYHIAKKANVPIIMVGFDFKNKQIVFSPPFYPSDDQQKDFDHIIRFFGPIQGKHPELGLGHLVNRNQSPY